MNQKLTHGELRSKDNSLKFVENCVSAHCISNYLCGKRNPIRIPWIYSLSAPVFVIFPSVSRGPSSFVGKFFFVSTRPPIVVFRPYLPQRSRGWPSLSILALFSDTRVAFISAPSLYRSYDAAHPVSFKKSALALNHV